MTVMFGCWQFNCVEEPPSVRPDIEKASTSPISLPYSDRHTKRERKRETEKREKNETRTYTEKRIDIVLLLLAMMSHRLTDILHQRHCSR
jgi:hypothetical protein